jgi:hypothetical protein
MELSERLAIITRRAGGIPSGAGRWGEFLSALLLGSWAIGIWTNAATVGEWVSLRTYTDLVGYAGVGAWMAFVVVFSLGSLLLESATLRFFGSSLLVWTWASLLYLDILSGEPYRPAWGTCFVGLLGAINGSARMWKRVSLRFPLHDA